MDVLGEPFSLLHTSNPKLGILRVWNWVPAVCTLQSQGIRATESEQKEGSKAVAQMAPGGAQMGRSSGPRCIQVYGASLCSTPSRDSSSLKWVHVSCSPIVPSQNSCQGPRTFLFLCFVSPSVQEMLPRSQIPGVRAPRPEPHGPGLCCLLWPV